MKIVTTIATECSYKSFHAPHEELMGMYYRERLTMVNLGQGHMITPEEDIGPTLPLAACLAWLIDQPAGSRVQFWSNEPDGGPYILHEFKVLGD